MYIDRYNSTHHDALQSHEERCKECLEYGPRARVVPPGARDEQVAEHIGRAEKVVAVEQVVE